MGRGARGEHLHFTSKRTPTESPLNLIGEVFTASGPASSLVRGRIHLDEVRPSGRIFDPNTPPLLRA